MDQFQYTYVSLLGSNYLNLLLIAKKMRKISKMGRGVSYEWGDVDPLTLQAKLMSDVNVPKIPKFQW